MPGNPGESIYQPFGLPPNATLSGTAAALAGQPPFAPHPALKTKGRGRKTFSDKSDDSVKEIFGLSDPIVINSAQVEEFLKYHQHLIPKDNYPMVAPKTYVGIEVEVENVLKIDPNINLMFWQSKTDGSLRNKGFEFVTPGCLSAGYAEFALRQLFHGMNDDVDFSNRTSIHIHMDVHQLSLSRMVGLLLTYTAVENLLFKYAGLNRRSNIFCVPLTETGLFQNLSASPTKFIWAVDSYWSKYTALNLLPITTQGSVEFRHLPGTKNIQQILGWIDLLTRLKVYTYKNSLQDIIAQISDLNGTSRYRQFVEGVFGEASVYLDMADLLHDMEKPVYIVKNSVISNKFDEQVKKSTMHESQFGQHLMGWAKKLKPEQMEALKQLCKLWNNPNLEQVFVDMVRRPSLYMERHPPHTTLIRKALGMPEDGTLPAPKPAIRKHIIKTSNHPVW